MKTKFKNKNLPHKNYSYFPHLLAFQSFSSHSIQTSFTKMHCNDFCQVFQEPPYCPNANSNFSIFLLFFYLDRVGHSFLLIYFLPLDSGALLSLGFPSISLAIFFSFLFVLVRKYWSSPGLSP